MKIVLLLLITVITFMVTAVLIPSSARDAFASPNSLSLGGTEKGLPKGITLSITTIDLETGTVVDNFTTKPRAKVVTQCDTRFCLSGIRASAVVRSNGKRAVQHFFGSSKGYGGEIRIAKNRLIRITKRRASTSLRASGKAPAHFEAASSQIRIGVPGSGFTINKELSNLIGSPTNLASTVTTTLVQSPCYRADGAYSIIEVDQRLLAERKKEFDLIKKGYVKNDPNFRDQYVRPDHSVRGNVSQIGNSATATVQITNSAGQVIASSTTSSADGGWFDALNRASLDLAGQLCQGPKISIALAQCFLRECSCGSNSSGYRIEFRVEGSAKLPPNALMFTNIDSTGAVSQSCGGVSASNFGSALGCRRTAVSQPENFEFNLGSVTPTAPSCSCPRSGAPEAFSFIATAIDTTTGERDDAFADEVRCVVTP